MMTTRHEKKSLKLGSFCWFVFWLNEVNRRVEEARGAIPFII